MSSYMPYRFSVAPMMDWTDRHCRMFHRVLSRHALLYTEMVTADAVIHGDRERLLGFSDAEHPVALQLGGSEHEKLAEAARIGEAFGYDEVNLNCGCPSDRVQSGRFGACLMAEPELVARGVEAMKRSVDVPVTVKCRIGIDDQDSEAALAAFAQAVVAAGADVLIVHARKAWLQGLSPRENRDVPPLDYDRVYRLKQAMPDTPIVMNGGIADFDEAEAHLNHVDGVMLGRAAYQNPWLLAQVDSRVFGQEPAVASRAEAVDAMRNYVAGQLAAGQKLNRIVRHMIGLYQGVPGARAFRRILTVDSLKDGADLEVLDSALAAVEGRVASAA
ncbi:tRNA dihydrouridine(20/20a) synthase DusA [Tepidamorphus sp. 3E244]|uniref:tRNA dihydrouridine(20/20a) synthase DusA n=1 Tax=Tepidamorphus sp. 3E244 TaxID=3385498 RepID=UPI0038FD2B9F